MCGICGVASDWLSDQEIKIFMELMHLNVLRGWDGAGAVVVPENGDNYECVRTTQTGTDLILSDEFKRTVREGGRKSILIGHTRMPTRGENVISNVHPFEEGHIIGVHNGTFRKINKDWVDVNKSDSRAVFETMAQKGLQDTITDVDGAYALCWIDKNEKTLNFLRNVERPLNVCRTGSLLAWSSEADDLRRVLSRAHPARAHPAVEYLSPDKHYVVPFRPIQNPIAFRSGGEVKPQKDAEVSPFYESFTERAERLDAVSKRNSGNRRGSRRGNVLEHLPWSAVGGNVNHANAANHNGGGVVNTPGSRTGVARHFASAVPFRVPLTDEEKADTALHEFETFPGWWVIKEKLIAYLQLGCDYCSHKADFLDYQKGHVHWADFRTWFCDDCWNNDGIMDDALKYFPWLKSRRKAAS